MNPRLTIGGKDYPISNFRLDFGGSMKRRVGVCDRCPYVRSCVIHADDCNHVAQAIGFGKTDYGLTDVKEVRVKSDGSTASYYELPKDCKELQDLISYRGMNAQVGEIFRACFRYGKVAHSEKLRDAKKMLFYAKAEVERLEKYGEGNSGEM